MAKNDDKNGGDNASSLSTAERKIIKIKPGVGDENDSVKIFEAEEDHELQKLIDTSQVRIHRGPAAEDRGLEKDAKSGKKSHRLRTALLVLLLLALGAFCIVYFGIVDLARFAPLAERKPAPVVKLQVPRKPRIPALSEERPPVKSPAPETHVAEPIAVRETPESVIPAEPETHVAEPAAVSEQPDPITSTPEPAPQKTPSETASLKEPPGESKPPRWVEGLYPYSVNLGSFGTPERMQTAVTTYGTLGLSLYWIQVDLGEKGIWFRLFTGFFRTRAEADAFIRENRIPDASSRHTKYAVLIGAYKSEKELNTRRLELSAMGCSSYQVKDMNGAYWLFTGAFYQMARAQKHKADLASKGIHGEVVER